MAFDNRFIGSWGSGGAANTKITADQPSGDGFWFRIGGKTAYSLPDANTLHYGRFQDGAPFIWKRVGSSPSNTIIIGSWRHEAVPAQNGDEGEDLIFAADGTYHDHFDSETTDYFGTFKLSQDANGLFIATDEYLLRLQTDGNAFTGNTIEGDVQTGVFSFSGDSRIAALSYTNPPGSSLTLQRT